MLPVLQTKVGNSAQPAFTVPSTFPAAGKSARVEVNGVDVAFTRTSSTLITLRSACRAGSIVNFYETDTPNSSGLVWFGTLDFPSIAGLATADLTVAIPGAEVGDIVTYGLPAVTTAGLVFDGFVSAADTVKFRASNITAGALNAYSGNYRISVSKA